MTTPFEHVYDLSRLSNAGHEVVIAAKADELKRLAAWLEVDGIQKFEARISLHKLDTDRYRYDAALVCDLSQSSVVTLEPVRSHIEEKFSWEFHVAQRLRRSAEPEAPAVIADVDDDVPEELDTPRFDLVGPLLEELSLALNPYPRAPGEAYAPPETPGDAPESPFAVLKKLTDRG